MAGELWTFGELLKNQQKLEQLRQWGEATGREASGKAIVSRSAKQVADELAVRQFQAKEAQRHLKQAEAIEQERAEQPGFNEIQSWCEAEAGEFTARALVMMRGRLSRGTHLNQRDFDSLSLRSVAKMARSVDKQGQQDMKATGKPRFPTLEQLSELREELRVHFDIEADRVLNNANQDMLETLSADIEQIRWALHHWFEALRTLAKPLSAFAEDRSSQHPLEERRQRWLSGTYKSLFLADHYCQLRGGVGSRLRVFSGGTSARYLGKSSKSYAALILGMANELLIMLMSHSRSPGGSPFAASGLPNLEGMLQFNWINDQSDLLFSEREVQPLMEEILQRWKFPETTAESPVGNVRQTAENKEEEEFLSKDSPEASQYMYSGMWCDVGFASRQFHITHQQLTKATTQPKGLFGVVVLRRKVKPIKGRAFYVYRTNDLHMLANAIDDHRHPDEA